MQSVREFIAEMKEKTAEIENKRTVIEQHLRENTALQSSIYAHTGETKIKAWNLSPEELFEKAVEYVLKEIEEK